MCFFFYKIWLNVVYLCFIYRFYGDIVVIFLFILYVCVLWGMVCLIFIVVCLYVYVDVVKRILFDFKNIYLMGVGIIKFFRNMGKCEMVG